jgi:formamidopyrimidine-DNA glycosylase
MVEAPRIRILYEKVKFTKGKRISKIYGPSYNKMNVNLEGYFIKKWWYAGKYIYLLLTKDDSPPYVIRTHTMMYGKIIVNEEISVNPRLRTFLTIELDDGTKLQWYLTQIRLLNPHCETDEIKSNYTICSSFKSMEDSVKMMKYDISNKNFNMDLLLDNIKKNMDEIANDILVDFLLNQKFFPGVGNILQQEALYRCRLLPTKMVKEINLDNIICLINALKEVIDQLYESYINKSHGLPHKPILQIYHKAYCPLGHKTITKILGDRKRRTTWCPVCQK